MTGNQENIMIEDDAVEIEKLLEQLEDWSSEMFATDWRDIENSGCISTQWYEKEKNAASERNYRRHLTIEKLRARLLCE